LADVEAPPRPVVDDSRSVFGEDGHAGLEAQNTEDSSRFRYQFFSFKGSTQQVDLIKLFPFGFPSSVWVRLHFSQWKIPIRLSSRSKKEEEDQERLI